MDLEALVTHARELGASDLHLEPGFPPTLRIRGELRPQGERVPSAALAAAAQALLGDERWEEFLERGSADLSANLGSACGSLAGTRCRVNVLRTARGVGLAVRLLGSSAATLKSLNLHPDLLRFVRPTHGLVLVVGPTGSGKSSTVAALLQEVNLSEARHILTLESPIEFQLTPRRSLIRQREVGRDTPTFAQGLLDALREDPDVLVVGELREPEVMRLALSAAETGHLVIATLHSATVAEALQRLVSAFPAEIQPGVCAQLADCLVGVIAQRLVWRATPGVRVPECEVLVATTGARAVIRQGHFSKLPTVLEAGGLDGCWSFARYRAWLETRVEWARAVDLPPEEETEPEGAPLPRTPSPPARRRARPEEAEPAPRKRAPPDEAVLVLDHVSDDLLSALAALERG